MATHCANYEHAWPKKEEFNLQIVSEYDQVIPQSQIADKHIGPRGRATQQSDKLSNATSSLFPTKMIAKLEWT